MNDAAPTADALRPIPGQDLAFAEEALRRVAFIRAFEAKALELSQTKPPVVVGSVHLCAGHEAIAFGTVAGLRDDDRIIATYRGHGWAVASGLDPAGLMAEICHRQSGLDGGRGGSAYMMAPDHRFIGENSIVGAGVPIACGVAMAEAARDRVVVVSIGDGAMSQGAVHEGLVFAAARDLPIILVCENNDWSELTPTRELLRIDRLAQRARAYGIPGVTIDGTDPIAVRDTIAAAADHARTGKGPTLVEAKVPRLWGHYNRDIEHYRPKDDKRAAEARDPLLQLGQRLVASGRLTDSEVAALVQEQNDAIDAIAAQVVAAPEPDPSSATQHVVALPDAVAPEPVTGAEPRDMTFIEAVNTALRDLLERDERTLLYGEDVGKAGGIFGASRYLQRDFGADRVFDTPIAESAILGSAVGAALSGLRPVVEIMWADFMLVALDQLINQAANVRYLTEGRASVPLVVRTQQGATPGSCAQHSQSLEALLAHIPGLKVALPATQQDAYDLLRAAHADPDPCIVIEARGLYQTRGPVVTGGPIQPAAGARLHREGPAAVVITWGTMVAQALAAADTLAAEGHDITVLDLRWLSPVDDEAIAAAVRMANGRVIVAHEAVRTGGFGAEIAARIHENCADDLRTPVRRVTTPDVRMPASPVLQRALVPSAATIVAAVREVIGEAAPA
ncbi:MAG: dehydrogenase [Bauldia sp.]|nr:dehydrogenase [Bauldia sp.]